MRGRERSGMVAAALLAALLAFAPAAEAANPKSKRAKRTFVYVLVVDGLDRDAVVGEGRAPFLSSLIDDGPGGHGVFYRNSRSVMVAETNPNHSSMITGAFPERHGIVGNAFATPGAGANEDSCPDSPGGSPVQTTGESPSCLEAETVFTDLERNYADRRFATALIMGKDKLVRLFTTEAVHPGTYDADYAWAPCDDPLAYCDPEVATNPISGYAANDAIVMDEVIRTTREGVADAGSQRRPRFTFANFPAVDTAGHTFGRTSAAYDETVAAADAELERFVANQRELGIWRRTVMIVTSDHSMDDTPQLAKVSLEMVLTAAGIPSSDYQIVGNGGAAHIYLEDRSRPDADAALKEMRAALTGSPSIQEALYRVPNAEDGGDAHTIASATPAWGLGGERVGDIVVTTQPGVAVLETSDVASFPFNPLQGNHGGTTTRDNFWLVAGGGRIVRSTDSSAGVSNANAAPTALRALGAKRTADAQVGTAKGSLRTKFLPKRR